MLMQTHEARLNALREELKRRGLDGFIVPISDEHMSEYVGDYAQRLGWLTGFGGSAGFACVTLTHAAIFVDGRYTVQVRQQVDEKLFEYRSVPKDTLAGWLDEVCESGARIAYDPWLHTWGFVEALEKLVGKPCDVQINVLEFVEEEDLPDNEALQFAVHAVFFDRPVTRRAEDFML